MLWPVLLLAGIERATLAPGDTAFTPLRFDSYPVSHSLVTVALWGALFGALHFWRRRRRLDACVIAALVVSHWLLDFASHRPDMPLWPGGPKLGLGLWDHVGATVGVETLMFAVGLWLAREATRPRDRIGLWGFVGLALLLAALYSANVTAPPPPNMTTVAWAGLLLVPLFLGLASWVDRHREPA